MGEPANITRNFLELRGVGIINIKEIFGVKSILKRTKIDLIIELIKFEDTKIVDRLLTDYSEEIIEGKKVPKLIIPVSAGRSLATIIDAAVSEFKNRKHFNYSSVKEIIEKTKNNDNK
jgi:HPr kinase/phosphorylase